MSAPTTAEVREVIAALRRDLDGKTIGTCSPADVALSGALAYAERETLPLAEHRDAAVAERDALAAEVARLKAILECGSSPYGMHRCCHCDSEVT